jgi:peptide chain release factor subunit 1
MLDTKLREIAALQSDAGIVSAYLKLDPRLRYLRRQALVKFGGAAARFSRSANDWQREVLDRETPRILRFLRKENFGGRAVVIFSSEPDGIWRVVQLDVLVPSVVAVDTRPQIETLVSVLDEHPGVIVCVVERDRASIYRVEQGARHLESEIRSAVPGWHDQGGWAQARFQRHIEFHEDQHLDKTVEALAAIAAEARGAAILLGGVEEVTDRLIQHLPSTLKDRVLGSFPVDFKHASPDDMLERARAVWVEAERRSEMELVARVVEEAHSGGAAVLGVEGTIGAIAEGRVQELLVADGVEAAGAECPNCGLLMSGSAAECPACGTAMEPAPDVIERAVERAFLSGARVESVFGEARHQLLALGGVAAKLRY